MDLSNLTLMKFVIIPTTDTTQATHIATDGSLRKVLEVEDGTSIQGPGELSDILGGLIAYPTEIAPTPPVRPFSVSKLKLVRALRSAGLEAMFNSFLASNADFATDFSNAQFLSSDDPVLTAAIPEFASASGQTVDQITALLKTCR